MKALIIYDSDYGNTAKVAEAIAASMNTSNQTQVLSIKDVSAASLSGVDVLIVGSPTQGGKPTQGIQNFLSGLPPTALTGIQTAAFDTRFAIEKQRFGLRLLMGTIGFAAPRIAAHLREKGGILAAEPEGFIVQDKEGPLREGELGRAAKWATRMIA